MQATAATTVTVPTAGQPPLLFALCGFEGSGKNKAAEALNRQGFQSHSFAYSLKKMVAEVFAWDFELLEGITDESRHWREQVDPWWAAELGIPGLTPRLVLKLIGTDVMRNHFDKRIWVLSLRRRLMQFQLTGTDIVITDCRYPSEAVAIKALGGLVVRINRRAAEPDWLVDFYQFCAANVDPGQYVNNEDYCDACAQLYYQHSGIHPAETSLIMYSGFDYQIANDASLTQLMNQLNKMLVRVAPRRYVRNIAIDFDDVLVPFISPFLDYCNRTLSCQLQLEDCVGLSIAQLLNCDETTAHAIFCQFLESEEHQTMHQVPVTEECLTALTTLAQHFGLCLVTARDTRLRAVTCQYLEQHCPGIFHQVCLANYYGPGQRYTKEFFCRQHQCQVLIDDSVHNIADLDNSEVDGLLFGDYPWNRQADDRRRVVNWTEVLRHFGL
jgi:uncharacterized HAD superfamily protein